MNTAKENLLQNLDFNKRELIDFTFSQITSPISFFDLGGVWGVNGAYTFYAIENFDIAYAFLVDTDFTDPLRDRSKAYKNLTLVNGNFGDKAIIKQLKRVDIIFLFDVLLHQVKPDWDEILQLYAPLTEWFVIYNPQFINAEKTVRLLDLGIEQYFENVPHDRNHPT